MSNSTASQINVEETLNTLVERFPALLPVLRGYGLDLCCGGGLRLREAAEAHRLSLPEVLAALELALG